MAGGWAPTANDISSVNVIMTRRPCKGLQRDGISSEKTEIGRAAERLCKYTSNIGLLAYVRKVAEIERGECIEKHLEDGAMDPVVVWT